jgi:predicted acetyltransferase
MIRELKLEDKNAYIEFVNDHTDETESDPALLSPPEDFAKYLVELEERKTSPREGFVPVTRYFLFLNSKIAGYVDCRWSLTETTLQYGGHIGYDIAPSFRGKSLSKELLKFGLEQYKNRGYEKVLLTVDEDNVASKKIIEKNGGAMENSFYHDGKQHCRYWITCD